MHRVHSGRLTRRRRLGASQGLPVRQGFLQYHPRVPTRRSGRAGTKSSRALPEAPQNQPRRPPQNPPTDPGHRVVPELRPPIRLPGQPFGRGKDPSERGTGAPGVSKFPGSWKLMPLEDCMSAIIDYRGKTPAKTLFGIPLVTAKVVKNGRIMREGREYIAAENYDSWMRRGIPAKGDVIITMEAPLGEIAQLDGEKVALAQRLITLRGKPGLLDNSYLKYAMQSGFVQAQLQARATGTTVVGIKQRELRKVMLPVPPSDQQRSIAEILGSLDDKIELNRRMNETLEAMARAIFKSWFVDFAPVWAKMDGRQPAGMDAANAALFPDSFQDSPLGEIPKG